MFRSDDIHTLTEFNRKPSEHIERITSSKRAEIITVNGKPSIVLQDVESYETMVRLAEYAESIQAIRTALTQEGRPVQDFMQEFEKTHNIN